MKLDFEIAVDQQTKAKDRNFEGVPDTRCQPVSNFGSILPNHLNMLKTMLWGALHVSTSLLNTYIKFYENWTKYYLSIFDRIWPINWANNNIFE